MDCNIVTDVKQYSTAIQDLFFDYIDWASTVLYRNFGLHFSADEIVNQEMLWLDKFMPPNGRLLIAFQANEPAGIACLKYLSGATGEIKRMHECVSAISWQRDWENPRVETNHRNLNHWAQVSPARQCSIYDRSASFVSFHVFYGDWTL